MSEGIQNHDWARYVAESTSDTINRLTPEHLHKAPLELVGIHKLAREVAATELNKLAHRYNSRSGLVAPNNVAYHLAEQATKISSWTPQWWMVAFYRDGGMDEYPLEGAGAEDAYTELGQIRTMPGVKDAKVELR